MTSLWPSMQVGRGVLTRASAGWRDFAVVTTASPWAAARSRLAAAPRTVGLVESLERAHLESLAGAAAGARRVVGIGGGLAMDAAKFLAWRLGVPLVQVPSATSNNACFTCTAGCLTRGRRDPLRGVPVPEAVLVDPDLLALAPARLNRAGVGDLLSSRTALVDWALAHEAGLPVDYDRDLAELTRAELARLAALAPAVGRDDPEALLALLEMGERFAPFFLSHPRARFNAASEHLLAWCLEERTGRRLVHGEIVSLGVLLMAHMQGHAPEAPARVVADARVAVQPEEIGTTWAEVEDAVLALPDYARDVVPWHTVVTRLADGRGPGGLRAAFLRARVFVEGLAPRRIAR